MINTGSSDNVSPIISSSGEKRSWNSDEIRSSGTVTSKLSEILPALSAIFLNLATTFDADITSVAVISPVSLSLIAFMIKGASSAARLESTVKSAGSSSGKGIRSSSGRVRASRSGLPAIAAYCLSGEHENNITGSISTST